MFKKKVKAKKEKVSIEGMNVPEKIHELEKQVQELKDSIYKVSNDLSQRVWNLEKANEIVISEEVEVVELANGGYRKIGDSVKLRKALLLLLDHLNLKIEKFPEKVSIIEARGKVE